MYRRRPGTTSLNDLQSLGLDPTSINVRRYGLSQRTVYDIAGRTVGDFLETSGKVRLTDSDRALLADSMLLMRYGDDMIDLYGVSEFSFAAALDDRSAAPVFYDFADRLKVPIDEYRLPWEQLLAASIMQRSCSDWYYPTAKAMEGEAVGEILWEVVEHHWHGQERAEIHSFLTVLCAATNLFDTLWDLREDGRARLGVAVHTVWVLILSVIRMALSRSWSFSFGVRMSKMIYRFYFKRAARHKWEEESPKAAWLNYRSVHPETE